MLGKHLTHRLARTRDLAFFVVTLLTITCATLLTIVPPPVALAAGQAPALTERHPDAGIWVMYRGNNTVKDLQKPYIKGVMAYATWNQTYIGENTYKWFFIDRELDFIINQAGKRAMVDVTAGYCPTLDWPEWMRKRVASRKAPNSHGCHPPQFWDPIYINLYKAYIRALATHLAQFDASDARPQETDIVFVRAEVMAETMENLPNENEMGEWRWTDFDPAQNGRIYERDLTKELKFDYQAEITLTYQRELARAYAEVGLTPPVAVAKGGNYWQPYPTRDQFVQEGVWFGQHSGAPNPQGWYYDIYSKVRSGETRGASETGGRLPQTLQAQYAYWEVLANLHYGVEFIGIYGVNRFYPESQPKGAVSYTENVEGMAFGERYAGHYRNPASSPGAWIALRGGYPEDRFGGKVFARHMWTNYEFLLTQYRPQDSVFLLSEQQPKDASDKFAPLVTRNTPTLLTDEVAACELEFTVQQCEYLWQQPDEFIGESNGSFYFTYRASDLGKVLYCGEEMFCTQPDKVTRTETMLWARRTNGAEGHPFMRFQLDDAFAQSLGGRARIRIVYLDQGNGQWELRYDSKSEAVKSALVVQKGDTNEWREVIVELNDVNFANRQEGGTDFSLFSMWDDDDIFHIIEVTRLEEPLREEPTDVTRPFDLFLPNVVR
jgi:hypothetical protein